MVHAPFRIDVNIDATGLAKWRAEQREGDGHHVGIIEGNALVTRCVFQFGQLTDKENEHERDVRWVESEPYGAVQAN